MNWTNWILTIELVLCWQTRRMKTRRLQWMISSQQKMPSTQSSTQCEFCCFILVVTWFTLIVCGLYTDLLLSELILALNRLNAIYGRDLYGSYIMEGLRKWSPAGGLQMLRGPPYGLWIVRQTFMLTWWSKTISLSGIYIYLLSMLSQAWVHFPSVYAMSGPSVWPLAGTFFVKPSLNRTSA